MLIKSILKRGLIKGTPFILSYILRHAAGFLSRQKKKCCNMLDFLGGLDI